MEDKKLHLDSPEIWTEWWEPCIIKPLPDLTDIEALKQIIEKHNKLEEDK